MYSCKQEKLLRINPNSDVTLYSSERQKQKSNKAKIRFGALSKWLRISIRFKNRNSGTLTNSKMHSYSGKVSYEHIKSRWRKTLSWIWGFRWITFWIWSARHSLIYILGSASKFASVGFRTVSCLRFFWIYKIYFNVALGTCGHVGLYPFKLL